MPIPDSPQSTLQSVWTSEKERRQAIMLAVGGVIAIVLGAIMEAATSSSVAACNSTLGVLGQAVNYGSSRADCGTANFFSSVGSVLLWAGAVSLVGTVALVFARKENAKKAAAAVAAKAAEPS